MTTDPRLRELLVVLSRLGANFEAGRDPRPIVNRWSPRYLGGKPIRW